MLPITTPRRRGGEAAAEVLICSEYLQKALEIRILQEIFETVISSLQVRVARVLLREARRFVNGCGPALLSPRIPPVKRSP